MTHLFQNPRSRWKHKAWGEAKRNSRVTKRNQTERAGACDRTSAAICCDERLSPTLWAFRSHSNDPWGSAALHPRLYAVAALRRLKKRSSTYSELPKVCATPDLDLSAIHLLV